MLRFNALPRKRWRFLPVAMLYFLTEQRRLRGRIRQLERTCDTLSTTIERAHGLTADNKPRYWIF